MPTFNTFDENRFPEDFRIQLQATMIKAHCENHEYSDIDHLHAIIDNARQENAEGNPRADQPATVDNLTKRDISTLFHFSQLSEAAAEMLMLAIAFQMIGKRAKLN